MQVTKDNKTGVFHLESKEPVLVIPIADYEKLVQKNKELKEKLNMYKQRYYEMP